MKNWDTSPQDARIPFNLGGGNEPGWSPDCQGKLDYDGRLVYVSTRYWPGRYSRDGRPSAKSSIMLCEAALVSEEFSADTEAQVKAAVEVWVFEQFDRLKAILLESFVAIIPEDK